MKARVIESYGIFKGQVYGKSFNFISGKYEPGWVTVTSSCFTRWGAKRELKQWKRKHYGEEIEI